MHWTGIYDLQHPPRPGGRFPGWTCAGGPGPGTTSDETTARERATTTSHSHDRNLAQIEPLAPSVVDVTVAVTKLDHARRQAVDDAVTALMDCETRTYHRHGQQSTYAAQGIMVIPEGQRAGGVIDAFQDRLARAIWTANGAYCSVSVTCCARLLIADTHFRQASYELLTGISA